MVNKDLNLKEFEEILKQKESSRINCIYILMDIKPYRKSIFLQILGRGNKFDKVWKKMHFQEKISWIKEYILSKWSKEEIIEHILSAINMFKRSEAMTETFKMALEYDLKEENKNV